MRSQGAYEPGKIQKVVWLTQAFPEAIEADLARYYHTDFVDLWRPNSGLTWRKLLVLIEHLPAESALNTALRNVTPDDDMARNVGDPVRAPWSTVETLLAALVDDIRIIGWAYAQTHSDKPIKRPQPISRPGVKQDKRKGIRIADAKAMDPRLRDMSDAEAEMALRRMTGRA